MQLRKLAESTFFLLSMNVIGKQCRKFIPINDGLDSLKTSEFYTFEDIISIYCYHFT